MLRKVIVFLLMISFAKAIYITDDKSFQNIYNDKTNVNKLVLMMYTAKTCPQCAYMKEKVFKDIEVKKFIDKNFVILEKDIHKDDLPENFKYFGIPTMFFIDKNGKEIAKIIGSSRANIFLEKLKNIIKE